MSNENARDAATVLYGETPASSPAPADAGQATAAAPGQTDNATSTETRSAADVLFSPVKVYEQPLKDGLQALRTRFGWTDEQHTKSQEETARLFHELEMSPTEANRLHGLYTHYVTNLPDDATVARWGSESQAQLQQRYGDQAPATVARVREYVASNKALHDMLHFTGLGNNPDIVLALAERASRLPRAKKS